jgi:RNA polymerase primary sigma factor
MIQTVANSDGDEIGTISVATGVDGWTTYLRAIGRVRRLTVEEELALGQRIADGDSAAVQCLVEANLRLVVAVAKHYRRPGVALEDLVQEGNIGLLHAAQRYDHRSGFRFSTYARWWIRHAIGRAVMNLGGAIRVPVHAQQALGQVARAQADPSDRGSEDGEMGWSTPLARETVELARLARQTMSLDQTLNDDEASALSDLVADTSVDSPPEMAEAAMIGGRLRELLAGLSEHEQAILRLRYGLSDGATYSHAEIGDRLHLTPERVRQLEARALARLRYGAGGTELAQYVAA